MKRFKLKGLVKIATYPYHSYETKIMFYNELGEQFVLCVDECQNCCEDFEFNCDSYTENEIVSTDGIQIVIRYDNKFKCDCGGAINIKITGTKKNYRWRVSNDHNGYYAHEVQLMKETGEYVWGEWL